LHSSIENAFTNVATLINDMLLQVHPNAVSWGQHCPGPALSQPYGLDPYSAFTASAYGMMSNPYFAASTAAGPFYGQEHTMSLYEPHLGSIGPLKASEDCEDCNVNDSFLPF